MGTAASAKASEALKGASVEDLRRVELSDADRAKLQEALATAGGPADVVAPAAAKEEAAAAVEAAAEGEGAVEPLCPRSKTEDELPHLCEYFKQLQDHSAKVFADPVRMRRLSSDGQDGFAHNIKDELQGEEKSFFKQVAKPLLEKSFARHDTNSSAVLEKDEAAVFFGQLVHVDSGFCKAISALQLDFESQQFPEGPAQGEAIEKAKADIQKREDEYNADKAARDAAAFKVLDTNGDGTLQKSEFIAAFEPGSEINAKFLRALGYGRKEEVQG